MNDIKSSVARVDLKPVLSKLYRISQTVKMQVHKLFLDDPLTVQISGTQAKFNISSVGEYGRVMGITSISELPCIIQVLNEDDVYWDIGANIGTHAILPATVLPEGKVIAVEPHSSNVNSLIANVKINNLDNISIEETAIGSGRGTIDLITTQDGAGYGGHSLYGGGSESTEVPMRTADSLITKYGDIPDVIKIDVEGAELDVLTGAEDVLEGCRVVFCEVHTRHNVQVDDVVKHLRMFGFSTKIIDTRKQDVQIKAMKN